MRHAGARTCRVRLATDEENAELNLEVLDDGKGNADDHRTGVGLSSMRERAAELGGSFEIEAVPSGGTRVRASLSFAPEGAVPGGKEA